MTARWVADVAPQRDLKVTWKSISLYFKNEPAPDSDYHDPVLYTHKLLRVLEAVRAAEGEDKVFDLYWEYGRRIHHDKDRSFSAADALAAVGLDTSYADAFEAEKWDSVIRSAMDEGLALCGNDVGTPILGFDDENGRRVGYFGPVITRVPPGDGGLKLWDGLMTMASIDGFWEIKRTRTERPEFGERP
ncbi:MAG: disulfide bond formation protein DsbA [Acidimicrobiia bacterium]|nr:disulfide bond formation protein DsbA [Acidimicrobiia bacterium]